MKKAFCVGINNYPGSGNDLMGCVNDARAMADLLVDHYDFPRCDVILCLDTDATKARILEGVEALLAGAGPGDVLVFTNSSHGTYVAEMGGDEPSYDEAICPYDVYDNLIIDDELRERFATIPVGVRLTVLSDSCFSGTVTRALLRESLPGLIAPDDQRRVRFFSPALRGDPVLANPWGAQSRAMAFPQATMTHVLLTGCTDQEYSYDAWIAGTYHGAMTYSALHVIRAAGYRVTYTQLKTRMNAWLTMAGYPQHPQCEGRSGRKARQVFT